MISVRRESVYSEEDKKSLSFKSLFSWKAMLFWMVFHLYISGINVNNTVFRFSPARKMNNEDVSFE